MSKKNYNINNLLVTANRSVRRLLTNETISPKNFPAKSGVYLIRNKSGEILYVGKAENLKRRINYEHISGEKKITTSTFRSKLEKDYELSPGPKMRKWIEENCLFAYELIKNSDMCSVVEALAIAILRPKLKEKLLNSEK